MTRRIVCLAAVLLATTVCPDVAAKAKAGRFTVSLGKVFDAATNRSWQKTTAQGGTGAGALDHTWLSAKNYCAGLNLDGGGWRVPTIRELESIVDRAEPFAIDKSVFAITSTGYYWSSTGYKSGNAKAWAVSFQTGTSAGIDVGTAGRVRCVR